MVLNQQGSSQQFLRKFLHKQWGVECDPVKGEDRAVFWGKQMGQEVGLGS